MLMEKAENNSVQLDAGLEHKFDNKGHVLSAEWKFSKTKNNNFEDIEDNYINSVKSE